MPSRSAVNSSSRYLDALKMRHQARSLTLRIFRLRVLTSTASAPAMRISPTLTLSPLSMAMSTREAFCNTVSSVLVTVTCTSKYPFSM